ncbi:MAG: Smr/MutS family protein [Candidatus Marinimicrobia bacterium]|nr:Smr/MutS family protein [Candidatus Neomarinimicrobiota bacterium]
MRKGLIQIAGIKNVAEARMLLASGADQIGFPFRLPDGDEDISEKGAQNIIREIGDPKKFVLITYLKRPKEIINLCDYLKINQVQLHDHIVQSKLKKLKQLNPKFRIIKSLIIKSNNLQELENYINRTYKFVDYYITDTFDPESGAIGATGKTHNWQISREICDISPKPVILAGGLNPKNVREAILSVKPDGVDAHTGLEKENGFKSKKLVTEFTNQAKEGFANIDNPVQHLPINGTLDLHTFQPKDVRGLVPGYIKECINHNINEIRIIHGKGKGVLRRIVHSILSQHPAVIHYETAKEGGGNWGATIATLKTNQ